MITSRDRIIDPGRTSVIAAELQQSPRWSTSQMKELEGSGFTDRVAALQSGGLNERWGRGRNKRKESDEVFLVDLNKTRKIHHKNSVCKHLTLAHYLSSGGRAENTCTLTASLLEPVRAQTHMAAYVYLGVFSSRKMSLSFVRIV